MSADDVNNLVVVLCVTGLVAVMVWMLPWADRKICGKLGLNLHGGLSTNPKADRYLAIRQRLLTGGILLYTLVFAWLTFFSRSAMTDYVVHVDPFRDQIDAFSTDHGFTDVFRRIFTEGFSSAFANVKLVRPEDLIQFYLNIIVFVPFGYLLPYAFRWFRERVRLRPALVCFLLSFVVENLQLLTKRGLYDLDDIISNTIGGFVGEYLYITFAYVVTHPVWRKNLQNYHAWRKEVHLQTLYPFRKDIAVSRTVLRASDADAVMDFYSGKLGYRMVARLRDPDSEKQTILLQLGRSQAEFRCDPSVPVPEGQELAFTASKIPSMLKRLQMNGIDVRTDYEDPCTDRRALVFEGPDHVRIMILEEI